MRSISVTDSYIVYCYTMILVNTCELVPSLYFDANRVIIVANAIEILLCTLLAVGVQRTHCCSILNWCTVDVMVCLAAMHAAEMASYLYSIHAVLDSESWLPSIGLMLKLGTYIFGTSIAFSCTDASHMWFLWVVEIVDIFTIAVGYANMGDDMPVQVRIAYFAITAFAIVGFSTTSSYSLWFLMRKETEKASNVASYWIWIIDVVTDIPTFAMTLFYKSYVGNVALTINLLLNVIALARVLAVRVAKEVPPCTEPSSCFFK